MTATPPPDTLLPGAEIPTAPRLEWLNWKLVVGGCMVLAIVLVGLLGPLFWDTGLAAPSSGPLNLPPAWADGGDWAHPLGTESLGRDMLALIIKGAPASFRVGVIAAFVGLIIATVLGFMAGYLGGWVDDIVRVVADAAVTIPVLAVMIVLAAAVKSISIDMMAIMLAMFAWPAPTRLIRAQVLTMRERGYVKMARLSGTSTPDIMFREILPNMIPYMVASLVGAISAAILAATSLEALGLGPNRVSTLGLTIFYAIRGSAILRGMWWWWGLPVLILVIIFVGLFLVSIGLDEMANPRLRRFTQRNSRRAARRRAAAEAKRASLTVPVQNEAVEQ